MTMSNCPAEVAISSNIRIHIRKGGVTLPKKKVSGITMIGNLKYLGGGYIAVYRIRKKLSTQS